MSQRGRETDKEIERAREEKKTHAHTEVEVSKELTPATHKVEH